MSAFTTYNPYKPYNPKAMPKGKPHNIIKRYALEDLCHIVNMDGSLTTKGLLYFQICINHSKSDAVKAAIADNLDPVGGNVVVVQTMEAAAELCRTLKCQSITGSSKPETRMQIMEGLRTGEIKAVVITVAMLDMFTSRDIKDYVTKIHWTCLCGIRGHVCGNIVYSKVKTLFYTYKTPHNLELAMLRRSIEVLGLAKQQIERNCTTPTVPEGIENGHAA